ncbi:hypothetical protein PP175_06745 [Aneurinibacillus sp. Ricciae_BoGa-3]|nr:hypothetical protein [Aneurinibacillus sp. Ricciae_BoGa-3]WCK55633.1 hypothetical protein PP175_06745 [Aneurinibacillus sp. Ricciae_BoGa-3]
MKADLAFEIGFHFQHHNSDTIPEYAYLETTKEKVISSKMKDG